MTQPSSITVERVGRRSYLRGNTYPIKDRLRSAGAHWDADQRAWWIGSDEAARKLAEASAPTTAPSGDAPKTDSAAPGPEAVVAGKAAYKGRAYYVAGRVERGRTHYDDRVSPVMSRDQSRVLLYSRDGKLSFWAPHDQAGIVKSYDRPQTIGRLQRFAAESRASGGGIPAGRTYECEECGERVTSGQGSCWETGAAH